MEESAEIETTSKPRRSYQKWAFRFFVYYMITQVGLIIFISRHIGLFADQEALRYRTATFLIISLLSILASVATLILSYQKHEKPTYQRKIALYGLIIMAVINVMLPIIIQQFAPHLTRFL